eukprot:9173602-Pyramimonas_sp.AAC.1
MPITVTHQAKLRTYHCHPVLLLPRAKRDVDGATSTRSKNKLHWPQLNERSVKGVRPEPNESRSAGRIGHHLAVEPLRGVVS